MTPPPPEPDDRRSGPSGRALLVEADGGSRGNPGVAGSGALVRDARTGRLLAERAEPLGQASNNVAEYTALVLGLEMVLAIDPSAQVEARMDSRLVVEQMTGRWKIKHEDMRRLAADAGALAQQVAQAGGSVEYRWVPRAQNAAADRLSNEAMDGNRIERLLRPDGSDETGESHLVAEERLAEEALGAGPLVTADPVPTRLGPVLDPTAATRLVLVRHGVTDYTTSGRLDGRGGANPPLNAEGQRQALAVARGVRSFLGETPARVVSSSLARAHQTGQAIAASLNTRCTMDEGWDEMAFGDWDGRRIADIQAQEPELLAASWRDDDLARPGGESRIQLRHRVRSALDRATADADPGTVVVVTHRGPILSMLTEVLGVGHRQLAPLMTAPASLTSLRLWPDGGVQVEFVNDTSHLR
ncbi:MAG TPA: bifunctional RNase H/acid phosphatase [Dermatophilaceae bacterium]|nr:bifunctional RNase H/acid phosphatase [Dermatophilaceae bacterium]